MDGKFDFIIPEEDLIRNLGVKYASNVMSTDEEYDDTIVKGWPNDEDEVINKYLNINLIFDIVTNNKRCRTVVKRLRVLYGIVIGRSHANPLFYTFEYDIEFTDGMQYKYGAKPIGESMYAQVDEAGHQFWLLAEIQYHQKDGTAISNEEGNIRSANGMERGNTTTIG